MKEYLIEREQWIDRPLESLFPFFSEARNLEELTPQWLGFSLVPPLPDGVDRDTRIYYRLTLAGIPIRWRTRISQWDPPRGFVDVQERGPFALWEHTHRFEELGRGVLMIDRVRYRLPLGPLGRLAHFLVVRSALTAIFDYRFVRIRDRFSHPSV
ncbi:SRPBCC family protein [Myxococcota bacterium]|nr:SRPBCC family protein [Myxococcota bacterium]